MGGPLKYKNANNEFLHNEILHINLSEDKYTEPKRTFHRH